MGLNRPTFFLSLGAAHSLLLPYSAHGLGPQRPISLLLSFSLTAAAAHQALGPLLLSLSLRWMEPNTAGRLSFLTRSARPASSSLSACLARSQADSLILLARPATAWNSDASATTTLTRSVESFQGFLRRRRSLPVPKTRCCALSHLRNGRGTTVFPPAQIY